MAAESRKSTQSHIAVVGDVHGHLQLALCMLARWQVELDIRFEAVLLCGDVGTFTDESQLDSATHSHARHNRCELEFLEQWSRFPQPAFLAKIFEPAAPDGDGLGLTCPVIMVHGNHEGFAHLEGLFSRRMRSVTPIPASDLRGVDSMEFIRYLPSGWRTVTESGLVIGGIGGMEAGQRKAKYHPMAYIDDEAVFSLLNADPVDVLITHQGPEALQGGRGSETLNPLLDRPAARLWFHGHGAYTYDISTINGCTIVPLGDLAFSGKGAKGNDPGLDGWSRIISTGGSLDVIKETPPFWREFRQSCWTPSAGGALVCPPLAQFIE